MTGRRGKKKEPLSLSRVDERGKDSRLCLSSEMHQSPKEAWDLRELERARRRKRGRTAQEKQYLGHDACKNVRTLPKKAAGPAD